MSRFKFWGVLIFTLLSAGCFKTETVVHVKPDGSGIIEETLLLSLSTLESMQNLSKEMKSAMPDAKNEDKAENGDPLEGMIRDAKGKAGQYGKGVRFLSAVPIKTETMGGYKALYVFDDVNTIKISQKPEPKAGQNSEGGGVPNDQEEWIRFKIVKGPFSTLTVTMPDPKEEKKAPGKKETAPEKSPPDPQSAEMMKVLFKDMGVKIAVKIEGIILKTNATYNHKSELTLFEMQFGKIMENPGALERVSSAQPKTIEEMKRLVKGLEGLKVEMNNPIVVDFK